jgi:hypothetical protein
LGELGLVTNVLDRQTLVNFDILESSSDAFWFYRFKNEHGNIIKIDLPRPKFFNSPSRSGM